MVDIKRTPEDFLVTEIPSRTWDTTGAHFVYKLTKRNMNTVDAIKQVALLNKISDQAFGYAGLKDKVAITSQYITVPQQLDNAGENTTLEHVGFTDQRLHLGELKGNAFTIRAYDVREVTECVIPNYFGRQRFSTHNVEFGVHILKGEWEQLAQKLARDYYIVKQALVNRPSEPIMAVKKAPFHVLLIYVHAVQSWLWNRVVSEYLAKCTEHVMRRVGTQTLAFPTQPVENISVPLVGAAQSLGEFSKYYEKVMKELEITPRDFLIRSIPGLTQEGTERSLLASVSEKQVTQQEDAVTLEFTLGPGSYATVCCNGWLR